MQNVIKNITNNKEYVNEMISDPDILVKTKLFRTHHFSQLNQITLTPQEAQKIVTATMTTLFKGGKQGTVYQGYVFRGDMRRPEEIFQQGFRLRSVVTDINQVNGFNGGFGGGADAQDPDGRGISASAYYQRDNAGAYYYGGGRQDEFSGEYGYTYLIDARDFEGYHLYANAHWKRYPQDKNTIFTALEINYAHPIPAWSVAGAFDATGKFIVNSGYLFSPETYPVIKPYEFYRVLSSRRLSELAHFSQEKRGISWQNMLSALDKMHTTYGYSQIKQAFILKNVITVYCQQYPDSAHLPLLAVLAGQLDKALFDTTMPVTTKNSIITLAITRPALAAVLLDPDSSFSLRHKPTDRLEFIDKMIHWINHSPELSHIPGVHAALPDNNPDFLPTFHIVLGKYRHHVTRFLSLAQGQGVLRRAQLNGQLLHLGYSWQDLMLLAQGNRYAAHVVEGLKAVISEVRVAGLSDERVVLEHFADKEYISRLQVKRLSQFKYILHNSSMRATEVNEVNSRYPIPSPDRFSTLFTEKKTGYEQIATLLQERSGLFISEAGKIDDSLNFVTQHMLSLKKAGIGTIGLVHLRRYLTQSLIDDYLKTGVMKGDLAVLVNVHRLDALFRRAFELRMQIVAMDSDDELYPTNYPAGGESAPLAGRAFSQREDNVFNRLSSAGKKFIVIYHRSCLRFHNGFIDSLQVVARDMQLPVLQVDSSERLSIPGNDVYLPTWESDQSSLGERTRQALLLVNQLASGQIKADSLTVTQKQLFSDFFPAMDNSAGFRLQAGISTDRRIFLQAADDLHRLLHSRALHAQLENLNGYEALQRMHNWDAQRLAGIRALYESAQPVSGIEKHIWLAPQALYLHDGSPVARAGAQRLSLAWLYTLNQDKKYRERLLNALQAHDQVNQRQADLEISPAAILRVERFYTLLDNLTQHDVQGLPLLHDSGRFSVAYFLNTVTRGERQGYYQLEAGNCLLALAFNQDSSGQWYYDLYDPLPGFEVRIKGSDRDKLISQLADTLNACLSRRDPAFGNQSLAEHYRVSRQNGQFIFNVRQLTLNSARHPAALKELVNFLQEDFAMPEKQLAVTEDNESRLPCNHQTAANYPSTLLNAEVFSPSWLSRINRITGMAAGGIRVTSWLQGLKAISHYQRRRANREFELTAVQKQREETDMAFLVAGMLIDTGGDLLGWSAVKLSDHVIKKGMARTGNRLIKLAQVTGVASGAIGSGLDLYGAFRAFSALAEEKNATKRVDLLVAASLSLTAAAAGITTTAMVAAGGTAAAVGAPLGVVVAMLLMLAGGIYSGSRLVSEIDKWVTLDSSQRWYAGLRAALGMELSSDVDNALRRTTSLLNARYQHDKRLQKNARDFLAERQDIDLLYYSAGEVKIKEHHYRKVLGEISGLNHNRVIPYHALLHADKIHPDFLSYVLDIYRHESAHSGTPSNLKITDSDYKFYTTQLVHSDDLINVRTGEKKNVVLTYYPIRNEQAGSFAGTEPHARLLSVFFSLGGGNDTATGYRECRNLFEVGQGRKTFTGGDYADSFLLMGEAVPLTPGLLSGGDASATDNEDELTAVARPPDGAGYDINFALNTLGYLKEGIQGSIVASLNNIEHARGHAQTADRLTGNEQNNVLDGAGGVDSLYGGGGHDNLILNEGYARGGTGQDIYQILQNTSHGEVVLEDCGAAGEVNRVLLDYTAAQVESCRLVYPVEQGIASLVFTLRNDNATFTTLTLADVDTLSSGNLHRWLLSTRDGLLLKPRWPQILSDEEPNLIAQYIPELDKLSAQWSKHTAVSDRRIHLQSRDNLGHGRVTIRNSYHEEFVIVLPAFMQLILTGTGYSGHLEGDSSDNILISQGAGAGDCLTGRGGQDVYRILPGTVSGHEILINNEDELQVLDILQLGLPASQITLRSEGEDLVIGCHDEEMKYPEVRIQHFMRDERYRHLALRDSMGELYELGVQETQAYLYKGQIT